MPSQQATTGLIVLGTLAVLAVSAWFFFGSPSSPAKGKGKSLNKKSDDAARDKSPKEPVKSVKKVETITVEDDESSDEEEDGEEENEQVSPLPKDGTADDDSEEKKKVDDAAALKAKYEEANKFAAKLISGQAYLRAAEKLTEIIDMAKHIPEASKDLIKLYNNRSAMYEKIQEYDKALTDIQVVLTLEHLHQKARVRRARIYEAQNKNELALNDYVLGMIVERFKGEQPTNEKKIEALCKGMAVEKSASWADKIKKGHVEGKELPSKSYCRMFFERCPNTSTWKSSAATSGSEISSQNLAMPEGADEWLSYASKLQQCMDTICSLIAADKFAKAFQLLAQLPSYSAVVESLNAAGASASPQLWHLLSLQAELTGSELHLKSNMKQADVHYVKAIEYAANGGEDNTNEKSHCSSFICANLKRALIMLELGETSEATSIYSSLLTEPGSSSSSSGKTGSRVCAVAETPGDDDYADAVSSPPRAAAATAADTASSSSPASTPVKSTISALPSSALSSTERAWVLLNRVALWENKLPDGSYTPNVISKCISDIDEALVLTANNESSSPENDALTKTARFQAFMKTISVLTQTKQQVGEMPEQADQIRSRDCILEAKKLFPRHNQILLLEADMLSIEGDTDSAIQLVSEAEKVPDADLVNCSLIKANIMTTKAYMEMQSPTGGNPAVVKPLLEKVDELYGGALEMEPNAIEVMAQWAQLKSMLTGDFKGAVELLRRAVPLARSTAEVQELHQLLVMNEAQFKAMTELQEMA